MRGGKFSFLGAKGARLRKRSHRDEDKTRGRGGGRRREGDLISLWCFCRFVHYFRSFRDRLETDEEERSTKPLFPRYHDYNAIETKLARVKHVALSSPVPSLHLIRSIRSERPLFARAHSSTTSVSPPPSRRHRQRHRNDRESARFASSSSSSCLSILCGREEARKF